MPACFPGNSKSNGNEAWSDVPAGLIGLQVEDFAQLRAPSKMIAKARLVTALGTKKELNGVSTPTGQSSRYHLHALEAVCLVLFSCSVWLWKARHNSCTSINSHFSISALRLTDSAEVQTLFATVQSLNFKDSQKDELMKQIGDRCVACSTPKSWGSKKSMQTLKGDNFSVESWRQHRAKFVVVLVGQLASKYWLTQRDDLYLCACKYFAVAGRCEHEQCVHHILKSGGIDLTVVGRLHGRPPLPSSGSKRGWSSTALHWAQVKADQEDQVSDVTFISNPDHPIKAKAARMAIVFCSLNCSCPTEPTSGRAVGVLNNDFGLTELDDPQVFYNTVQAVNSCWRSRFKSNSSGPTSHVHNCTTPALAYLIEASTCLRALETTFD
ncbi:Nlrc3, partial [Symbiodinium sp. CCMP2456]